MQLVSSVGAIGASLFILSLLPKVGALPTNSSSSATINVNVAQGTGSVVYHSSTYPAGAAKSTAIIVPSVVASKILGPATQSPASQYIAMPTQALPSLSSSQKSNAVMNADLATNYQMWNGSGTIDYKPSSESGYLRSLNTLPSYSRDSGRGGHIGNTHIFVFADTDTYTEVGSSGYGSFTGAVSNTVATDVGMLAANGKPPAIQDTLGSFASANGASRGFVPWTSGEMAYNLDNIGKSRWAIWPAQSLITLNPTTALQYSPIVWVNGSTYTQAGVTLCEITIGKAGPVAERVAARLYDIDDLQCGVIGGIRSYGSSGTNGGNVYILGKVSSGLMLGRVAAGQVADKSAYEYYYPGDGWKSDLPGRTATNVFYSGSFSAVDIFYSPRHLTFIMVYMNDYVDNTIYWRYLQASSPILPTYAGGKSSDIAQYLTQYKWSGQQTLLSLPTPPVEFSYDGGAQPGYFGANDITRGGTKMLLSWTEPNGGNAASTKQGYWLNTATVTWA